MNTVADGYHSKVRRKTNSPPPQGTIAARATLRVLALSLVQRIDNPDADLATLARQCEQAGRLALAELDAGAGKARG